MITLDFEQCSPAWFAARAGIPTASNFKKIITSTGKPSTSAAGYAYELAGERIVGKGEATYSNANMERGVELEPVACELYEFISGFEVSHVGMCYQNEDKLYSCSPDGLIVPDGGLEIKCPKLSTHTKYLHGKRCPADYVPQVQGSLFITGRKWWDFISYHPDMPPFLIRCYPDLDFHKKLKIELDKLLSKINKIVEEI